MFWNNKAIYSIFPNKKVKKNYRLFYYYLLVIKNMDTILFDSIVGRV